ncbi:MAG TPA: alanine--tRNA ligase [Solirubrobacteraceae bacterium]|nr:alanine--tRNA ligase [Solirubrobacteraceae bacterium]
MTSEEIREAFFAFFEEREHRRISSGSLVPGSFDPSVLLTTAGMQPLLPYFLGHERPPHPRLTSCQKCFRTVDIDVVGTTARHLTFFEMLGNFSIGDYFKHEAIEFAWELSLGAFGFDASDIWITVFEGDEQLGLGPDEEAIGAWQAIGVPRERIVALPRSENFWQAGPLGPCGPCSELYLDRGPEFGSADDLPGGDNDRFLEYWNLVFMQYNQGPSGQLESLPARSIDTGLGLDRMAAIQQGVASVFDTDQFSPLMELGEQLSGRRRSESAEVSRSLRVLADHTRGMTFLIADGVVPSNEERGYVLRRIMRRAIQQGRGLGMAPGFLARYSGRVRELMSGRYPELDEQRDAIVKWLGAEEDSFGHTLEQGTGLLEELIVRARESGATSIEAADAFALHDTYGFPFHLTQELLAEQGLSVEQAGFDALMDQQRARARAGSAAGGTAGAGEERQAAQQLVAEAAQSTQFTGYATVCQATTVAAVAPAPGDANGAHRLLVKLSESPFYAQGGGQVSDSGVIECDDGDCRAQVAEVFRLGDDQALAVTVERGELREGERVTARVDPAARRATECNHTATHLLQAALRARLGNHVRQAGSYVGPDKLRFDFSHSQALSAEELREIEHQVNAWILDNHPVRPITTTLDEARRLGAMALFGEKYGDVVRMVEVGDGEFSRELCGGTHVRRTAEIGVMRILSETSSAANVRRIEALTGPAAVSLLLDHDHQLREIADHLRTRPEDALPTLVERESRRRELEKAVRGGAGGASAEVDVEALVGRAKEIHGAQVLVERVAVPDARALLEVADRTRAKLGEAAVVLGCTVEGRVHLVAGVAPGLVARGVRAGQVVKAAAALVGGGGGGRDTMAQAGGRDPEKLPDALAAGLACIEAALANGSAA